MQGYNRVAVNAALNTSQSVLEIAVSWVVLSAMPAAPRGRLAALGAVSIACASLFAIVGVCFLLKADWTRLTGPHSPSTFPVDFDALTRSAALVSNHSVRSHPLLAHFVLEMAKHEALGKQLTSLALYEQGKCPYSRVLDCTP